MDEVGEQPKASKGDKFKPSNWPIPPEEPKVNISRWGNEMPAPKWTDKDFEKAAQFFKALPDNPIVDPDKSRMFTPEDIKKIKEMSGEVFSAPTFRESLKTFLNSLRLRDE